MEWLQWEENKNLPVKFTLYNINRYSSKEIKGCFGRTCTSHSASGQRFSSDQWFSASQKSHDLFQKQGVTRICGGKWSFPNAELDTGIRLQPLLVLTPKPLLDSHHSGRLLTVTVTRSTCCPWLPSFMGQIFTESLAVWRQLRTVCSLWGIRARGGSVHMMLREKKQWT